MRYSFALAICLGFMTNLFAQSQKADLIRIMISPSKPDMVYETNEEVQFLVAIYKFGQLVENAEITYTVGPEMMEPSKTDTIQLKSGQGKIKGGRMSSPGFIRCYVTYTDKGEEYKNSGTAGIAPENIQPTTTVPSDFLGFWQSNLDQLSEVPLEPLMSLMPERSTHLTNVYHVSFKNIQGRIYGILSVPKKEGKYPAILHVPGAGVRPYYGTNLNENVISLQVGIHGVPVNEYGSSLYQDLGSGPLNGYMRSNLDDKNNYYYKRVYLGFNDNVCPPTSIYAVYNSIVAEKELSLYLDASHWQYPEQGKEGLNWMFDKLGVN
jgi:hypothetical protein